MSEKSKLKDMFTFLENHCKYLQRSHVDKQTNSTHSQNKFGFKGHNKKQIQVSSHVTTERPSCILCKTPHALYQCTEFKNLPVDQRLKLIKENHLCFNCLGSEHGNIGCRLGTCRKCSKKHHTLFHLELNTASSNVLSENNEEKQASSENKEQASHVVGISQNINNEVEPQVILSTAIIYIQDRKKKWDKCKAFLDNGSQPNLITKELCEKLELPVAPIEVTVTGVTPNGLALNECTRAAIKSKSSGFETILRCLVTSRITNFVPISARDLCNISYPPNIQLADPVIGNGRIDLLIGAGLFWDLLSVGQIKLGSEGSLLQKTVFGWILAGQVMPHQVKRQKKLSCHLITNQQLHEQVERLWTIEDVGNKRGITPLDPHNPCEQHFNKTTKRHSNGQFVVNTLYSDKVTELGNSFEMAKRRLHAVERKLERDAQLKEGYNNFMNTYLESGDMTEVPPDRIHSESPTYYLPHHAVMKPDSTTTKLRVVFDGSAKTTSGLSLNDVQNVGPTVQDDLFSIMLRFRQHKYVLSADIEKMYRRVIMDEDQRKLQRILWRTDTSQPIKVFELNTVTYGTAAAPYLATRCLRQLGEENKLNYPSASKAIIEDFYVDDVLTGKDTLEELQSLKRDLVSILKPAGFSLRKWASNNDQILKTDDSSKDERKIEGDKDPKTLGLM